MSDFMQVTGDISIRDIRQLLRAGIDVALANGFLIVDFIAPAEITRYVGWEDVNESERRILMREKRNPLPQQDIDFPVSEGGAVVFSSEQGISINGATRWRLDLPTIKRGLRLFSEQYGVFYHEWCAFALLKTPSYQEPNYTEWAVVFLQLCLFNKIPVELGWSY